MACTRCRRNHSGVCGIPPSAGLVNNRVGIKVRTRIEFRGRKPSPKTLQYLLERGSQEREKLVGTLNTVSPEMEEYNRLLEKLDKLDYALAQMRRQLV